MDDTRSHINEEEPEHRVLMAKGGILMTAQGRSRRLGAICPERIRQGQGQPRVWKHDLPPKKQTNGGGERQYQTRAVLYYTVLCYAVLYCTVLSYAMIYCALRYCGVVYETNY
jgi:hypothetical protein